MMRVGIIAALQGELKPVVAGWERLPTERGHRFCNMQPGLVSIAVCCGIGREAAARACMLAMEGGPLDAMVSVGWAGALSSASRAGEAYTVTEVVDASTGERYETAAGPAESMRLVTTKRVALREEKSRLAEHYGAQLVDMEAATVARLARVREIPFYCYKAVSDSVEEVLPDMNAFITQDGQMETGKFATSMLIRPRYWPAMVRMGRNSRRGAVALAEAIHNFQGEMQ